MLLRRINWPLWVGLLLTIAAFMSYFFIFVWFPFTRDFPWANFVLFAARGSVARSWDCDVALLRIARIPRARRSSAYL